MVPAIDLGPGYALRTSNRSLDSLAVRPRILNGSYERPTHCLWEGPNNLLPERAIDSRFDLAEHHRDLGFVDNAHRVLTVLLQPEREFPALDLLEFAAL